MKKVFRYAMMVFGSLLIVLSIINFLYVRSFTLSVLITPTLLLIAGAVPLCTAIFYEKVKELCEKRWFKGLLTAVAAVYVCGMIFVTVMFSIMIDAGKPDEVPADVPAVVLGAMTFNDKPSKQLAERLDSAYDYLIKNPNAMCIVTGGTQNGCTLAQGTIMKNYLVEKGIASERIIEENEAWDTNENLEFSKKILEENNLGTDIALVTSEYHQYRSQLRAKQYGLTPYCVPSRTRSWWHLPQSYLREMIGFLEYIILG